MENKKEQFHDCPFCKGTPGRIADEDWPDFQNVLKARFGHFVVEHMQKVVQGGVAGADAMLAYAEELGLDKEQIAMELLTNPDGAANE